MIGNELAVKFPGALVDACAECKDLECACADQSKERDRSFEGRRRETKRKETKLDQVGGGDAYRKRSQTLCSETALTRTCTRTELGYS